MVASTLAVDDPAMVGQPRGLGVVERFEDELDARLVCLFVTSLFGRRFRVGLGGYVFGHFCQLVHAEFRLRTNLLKRSRVTK